MVQQDVLVPGVGAVAHRAEAVEDGPPSAETKSPLLAPPTAVSRRGHPSSSAAACACLNRSREAGVGTIGDGSGRR
ncbi:hypothetical protein ABZ935_21165 [Streptomyces coeruleorubidus]|uniref:hypothetical protein n=1 Tax=Streptomyces coeruleorubidus TaxID=116188 RepID=UPI0033E721E1